MAVAEIVQDPGLQPLLELSQRTMAHILEMIDWVDQNETVEVSPDVQLTLSKNQKTMMALLSQLRGHNRRAIFAVRATKQETAEARQEVDRLLLQLQNLYYEQRHLIGEISVCEGHDHAYTHLPILPLDEYLEAFPQHHDLRETELMPLRIQYEKQQREALDKQRQELLKTKENLTKVNTKKKLELKKMDEQLEKMIDTLKPLGESLAKEI